MAVLVARVILITIVCLLCTSSEFGWNNCSESEFPCDSVKQCVFKNQWCDSVNDCKDDSDEEYCHFGSSLNRDPNFCGREKFICNNGPCIPFSGRCDGVSSCSDNSDEQGCENSTTRSTTKGMEYATKVSALNITSVGENSTTAAQTANVSYVSQETTTVFSSSQSTSKLTTIVRNNPTTGHIVPVLPLQDYSILRLALHYPIIRDQELARMKAQAWLLQQEDENSSQDIARKTVALHLSNETFFSGNSEKSKLISRLLQMQLAVDLIRNDTKPMSLSQLALYVNALLASCFNPFNFHGVDLAHILRLRTDAAIMAGELVSPTVYLTLCIVKKGSYQDVEKLEELVVAQNKQLLRLDIQALALLAASCYWKVPELSNFNSKFYAIVDLTLERLESLTTGTYSNVYSTSLLIQAFAAAGVSEKEWRRAEALDFLLGSQNADGSFGDVLATYYAMPSLSGNDLESLKNPCYLTEGENGLILSELSSEERKNLVRISLVFGNTIESALTLQLKVEEKSPFLDALRLAGSYNPLFRLKYDNLTTEPVVYSIGDLRNDAERGMFWNLYVEEKLTIIEEKTLSPLTPFMEDIRTATLKNGSHIIFWFKKVLN